MKRAAKNPVREWLRRVALECGSPEAMDVAAQQLRNDNTQLLVERFAQEWAKKQAPGQLNGRRTA